MRVTTGYSATIRAELELEYTCSNCGAKNKNTEYVEGVGTTGLFFGKIVNEDFRKDAQNQLEWKLKVLQQPKPSDRYRDMKFRCKCSSCGKREPWARMSYNYVKVVWKIIAWTVMFAFAFFVGELTAIPILIELLAMLWASLHKPIHKSVMIKRTDELPEESLPSITAKINNIRIPLIPEGTLPRREQQPEPVQPPKVETPKPEAPKAPPVVPKAAPVVPQPVPPRSAILTLTSGPMAGSRFRCREGMPVLVGRSPSKSNLVLSGYEAVSGLHCRIEVTRSGMTVTDLGSSNGTWVGDRKLIPGQPEPLPELAELRLASENCIFRASFE